jgi:hypothetical protein
MILNIIQMEFRLHNATELKHYLFTELLARSQCVHTGGPETVPLDTGSLVFPQNSEAASGSVVVKALCYKPEGRGIASR